MARKKQSEQNQFVAYSGSAPTPIAVGSTNESYTSANGTVLYVNFTDIDSSGLFPSSGIQSRFSVTKILAGNATTVTPVSTYVDSALPKTVQLTLSSSDKVIDGLYSTAGIITASQTVFINYTNTTGGGYGTIPLLSDNDSVKSQVVSFSGLGVSNRTSETIAPVFQYAYTSTDGSKVYAFFKELNSPPLLPPSGITGFTVLQSGTAVSVTSGIASSTTVELTLASPLFINDGSNSVTLSYTPSAVSSLRLRDSSGVGNTVLAFAGSAVTNLTAETEKPTIISAITAQATAGSFPFPYLPIYVQMSEPTLPGTSATGFSVYVQGTGYVASTVESIGSTTYAGSGVTQYTISILRSVVSPSSVLELDYQKQSSNYITDQSANLNQLDSLSNRLRIQNKYNGSGVGYVAPLAPGDVLQYLSTESFVDTNGTDLYVTYSINREFATTPSTGISGFTVFVDGQVSPIKSAVSLDNSFNEHVKISLYNKIFSGSGVSVSYRQGNLQGFLVSGYANLNNFEPLSIANNSLSQSSNFFDVYNWNDNINSDITYEFDIDDNSNELYRKVNYYPAANVILDRKPPRGIAIINRGAEQNETGIKIHKFDVYGEPADSTSVTDFEIQNLLQGWEYIPETDFNVSSVSFKLKKSGTISNTGNKIEFLIYTGSETGDLVGKFGEILFDDLTNSYQIFTFNPTDSISLKAGQTYWVILSLSVLPQPIISTSIYVAQISETNGVLSYYDATEDYWVKTQNVSGFFKIYDKEVFGSLISSKDILLDIYEKPVREASIDTETGYKTYELFGDKQTNYYLKKLNKFYEDLNNPNNDIFPTVYKVVIGASSARPKNYILEIKQTPTSEWTQVFDTLVDETTLDNLVYVFDSPISICQLRLVYKGDYFTIDETGTLSIAAVDDLSNTTKAQISHFEDFRDAVTFNNADETGFISFSEGLTEYENWGLTNSSRVFKGTTNAATSDVLTALSFNTKLILGANNKIFTFYDNQTNTISNEQIVASNKQITCSAVYKNRAYIGTSDGLVYSSLTGEFWTLVNPVNPLDKTLPNYIKPVKSMVAYNDKLYIGTSKGTSSYPSIYTYDGKVLSKLKDFDTTYEFVSSLASANFNLYIGLGNIYGSGKSAIYKYDNIEWTQTLSSTFDNVEAMTYSTSRDSIVAAFRGGDIWELPFSNNLPKVWSKIYDTNSDRCFSINDDVSGKYLFINTDAKSVMYVKSIDSFKVVSKYFSETQGLNFRWRKYDTYAESYSTDLADKENYTSEYYGVYTAGINTTNFSPSGFGSSSNVLIAGKIKAKNAGDYKFKAITNMATELSVGGLASSSNYSSIGITTNQTLQISRTFSLAADETIDFTLSSFVSTGTTASMNLYWNNTTDIEGFEIIPSTYLMRPENVKAILPLSTSYYGVGSDGKVYDFEPTYYATRTRNVYVRFEDEAGNIHGLAATGQTVIYNSPSDKIVQDLNTVDSAYQTKGKIYQVEKSISNELSTRVVYTPNTRQYSVYAPDRRVRETGYYEAQPFFVPTLVKWNQLTALIINKYGLNLNNGVEVPGLDAGTSVKIFVKTGSTRTDCINAAWDDAYEISYINDNSNIPAIETLSIPLQSYNGKWLQYKFELISATKNLSPEIVSTTVTYSAGTASYYFTRLFDTSDYDSTSPLIRRGLLTSNELLNNGTITYGYINTDNSADVYDFNKYSEITPNAVFEISQPTSKIKFGILFTSVGTTPSVVYDFAVQLDLGDSNIKFMPSL